MDDLIERANRVIEELREQIEGSRILHAEIETFLDASHQRILASLSLKAHATAALSTNAESSLWANIDSYSPLSL